MNCIETIPNLPASENDPEDIDTKAEDPAYDAMSYMVMPRTSGHASIHKRLQAIKDQTYKPKDNTFGY